MGWTNPEYTERVSVSDGKVSATFTVEILSAEEDRHWAMERGNVVDMRGCLRVTTHTTHDDAETIVIRKRAYTVDEVYMVQPGYPGGFSSSRRDHYARGVRNENGGTLEYGTATRKQLENLAELARGEFVKLRPSWERTSVRRALLGKITREEREAAECRRVAAQHDAKVAELRDQLDRI